MTRQEFVDQYPTPQYVLAAWSAMHQDHDGTERALAMAAWESACRRARAEADAAYDAQQLAPPRP